MTRERSGALVIALVALSLTFAGIPVGLGLSTILEDWALLIGIITGVIGVAGITVTAMVLSAKEEELNGN
jgi:hypothetical protein